MYLSPSHFWWSKIYKIVILCFSHETTTPGLMIDSHCVQYLHAMLFLSFLLFCFLFFWYFYTPKTYDLHFFRGGGGGGSSLNFSKFTKICSFLFIPRACCLSKICLGPKNRIFFIMLFLDVLRPSSLDY